MTTEQQQREAVIAAAREWLGTPYHHRAAVKGAGVDCLYLLAEVYSAAGLIEYPEIPHYAPDIGMHRHEETYIEGILRYAHEVDEPKPGDVAVWRFGRIFWHGAVVVAWPTIIHAYRREGGVVIGDGTVGEFISRPVKFFSLWGD